MAFNPFKKRDDGFVDLTERYKKQQQKIIEIRDSQKEGQTEIQNVTKTEESSGGFFGGFFSGNSINEEKTPTITNYNETMSNSTEDERRRKLAKRLMDMTDKIEDLSNQIYHLQQRVEVLERKTGSSGFGY